MSEVQSILISCFAFFLLASDEQRRGADWRERLWGYNGATGLLQACVAGYFLWDVQVCILHFDVEGVGSFVHAIGALAVTCLGFVSSPTLHSSYNFGVSKRGTRLTTRSAHSQTTTA